MEISLCGKIAHTCGQGFTVLTRYLCNLGRIDGVPNNYEIQISGHALCC